MKTLFLLLLMCLPLKAAKITFEWDAPPPEEVPLIAGVQLWEKMPDKTYRKVASTLAPIITEITTDFAPGQHTVVATYYDAAGVHSDFSNELVFSVLNRPGTPRIKIAVQSSTDGVRWDTLAIMEVPEVNREFLRLAFVK